MLDQFLNPKWATFYKIPNQLTTPFTFGFISFLRSCLALFFRSRFGVFFVALFYLLFFLSFSFV